MALVALLMASVASAVPETAIQGAVAVAQGTDVTQDSANTATVDGSGATYAGDIVQVGAGTDVTNQDAANTLTIDGDDSASAQGITQAGSGNTVTQDATNTNTATGDNAAVGQSLVQSAVAETTAIQTGDNAAYVEGDGASIGQSAFSSASGTVITQLENNVATVTGNNPIAAQIVAASAIGSTSIDQGLVGTPMGNSLTVNAGSTGGAAAQSINNAAIGGTVSQITENLVA